MTRLVSILLMLVMGSMLPAAPQNCCDPAATGKCHHSKTPRQEMPCQPEVSACADMACLIERQTSNIVPAQLQRTSANQPEPELLSSAVTGPVWTGRAPDVSSAPPPVPAAKLFLRNHILVI